MARNIAQGNGWGDIGATPEGGAVLRFPNDPADPFLLMALLELHRASGNAAFLDQAQTIGRNILKQRVRQGWFVPSQRHVYCRLGNNETQALLHLAAALMGKPEAVPAFTGAVPFFQAGVWRAGDPQLRHQHHLRKDPIERRRAMKKVNLIAAALLAIGLTARLFAAAPTEPPAQVVSVTVDYQAPSVVSKLEIGLTHTQAMWENGHPEAVARVKKQLEEARIRYQNQHIMGWGANNPEPSPGVYSWSSLDHRIELIRSMANTIPVITFCTAPGWMKASGKDWNMEERVADEHVRDFANLCRAVA